MLDPVMIFSTALLVGFSGAVMPGPLTAVTVEHTLRRGYVAAPLVILGHGFLEVIMVALLLLGLGHYLVLPAVAGLIGLLGGLVLAWMSIAMLRGALKGELSLSTDPGAEEKKNGSALFGGVVATASNPYWFLWWATVGAGYVALSQKSGLLGVFCFFGGHIMADFLWLSLLAVAIVSGKKWLTANIYRYIVLSLGIFLLGFSFYFFHAGLKIFLDLNA